LTADILVLGIGNTLLRDEGVGVHVARHLADLGDLPEGVEVLDGGTGSLVLLEPMRTARRMILIDAAADGAAPGTLRRIVPRFSADFPPSLTAHDIGLKDLLDIFYLLGETPEVVLYTVSIAFPQEIGLGMSPEVAGAVLKVAASILEECRTAPDAAVTRI
jgi:hydrogenase maturation protease